MVRTPDSRLQRRTFYGWTRCFARSLPDGWKIGVVLGLLVVALILFAIEAISVDLITLLLLLVLISTRVLSAQEAFSGFGSEIIVILASIFVLCGAVQRRTKLKSTAYGRCQSLM